MGPAAILVLLVLFAASLPGQGGDFEPPCAPGNVSPAGCPSDQWTTTPGGASGMTTVFTCCRMAVRRSTASLREDRRDSPTA